MFDRVRRRLGLGYARFHFRKHVDGTTRFSDVVTRSRRALVIFPEDPVDSETAETLLRYLTRRFANGSTLVLVREDRRNILPPTNAARVVTYSPEELTAIYTPKAALLRRLKTSTFDVAFDLNVGFTLPSAFLCLESRAPVRVSFAKANGDEFYNLQVQARAAASPTGAYQSFLRCLDML